MAVVKRVSQSRTSMEVSVVVAQDVVVEKEVDGDE